MPLPYALLGLAGVTLVAVGVKKYADREAAVARLAQAAADARIWELQHQFRREQAEAELAAQAQARRLAALRLGEARTKLAYAEAQAVAIRDQLAHVGGGAERRARLAAQLREAEGLVADWQREVDARFWAWGAGGAD